MGRHHTGHDTGISDLSVFLALSLTRDVTKQTAAKLRVKKVTSDSSDQQSYLYLSSEGNLCHGHRMNKGVWGTGKPNAEWGKQRV